MNRYLVLLSTVFLSLTAPIMAEHTSLPAGSQGEVTLDWPKFHELWTKMEEMQKKIDDFQKPENLPPVPFTITKAAYKGAVGEKKTAMTALLQVDVYDPKNWVKVPFLPASVAMTDATLDGQPVGIFQENDFHQILLKKPGRHSLQIHFTLPSPKPEEEPQLSFAIVQTPITMISLEFPRPNLDVHLDPSQGMDVRPAGDKHTLVTAALSPTTQISVHWQKAAPEETAGPAKIYVDSQHLFTVNEGTLKSHWILNYSILRHGVRELRVRLPPEWNLLAVNAEGLQEWKSLESPNGPVLQIQFAYAHRGNLEVTLELERALGDKDEVLDLPHLVPLEIEREQGSMGIEAKGAVELQVQNADGLQAIDPQELPAGLSQSATQPILFAYRFTKSHALALSVKRHPQTPVLTTTVDDANAISVLTDRGQVITKIRYQVRNQLKQYLAIHLPDGSELWSVFVAGEPVKPTRAEDGSYRIPLAKSQLGSTGQQGFPVEVIYYRQTPKFIPFGFRSLSLPMPDAPVSRMGWSLYLPEKYRFPYFGGDVEKGEAASLWNAITNGAMLQQKELDKASGQPAAARSKNDGFRRDFRQLFKKLRAEKSAMDEEKMVDQQAQLASSLFQANGPVPTASGVFPVAFELPASGQLFNFGQIMVVGQDPTLNFVFFHARLVQLIMLILLVGAAGLSTVALRNWPLTSGLKERIRSRINSLI